MPFAKGKSGNPGGRPKAVGDALKAFHDPADLEHLRRRLLQLADSVDGKVAIAAIHEYHDRAYGKAPQAHTGEEGGPITVGIVVLPPEELD